jgi:hypothetical protein
MNKLFYTVLGLLLVHILPAQTCRYLEEIFPSVIVTPDIVYGRNASVLEFSDSLEAIPKNLILDLYEPEGDTAPVRALIIYFHSGNFLPWPNNGDVVGTRRDSSSVEICKKLARCGYVVASADYRLGWNPGHPLKIVRTTGIINAAYRALQDARTCIRFFRKGVLDGDNPYKIDDERIALFGDDTGGYLATHASALDRYEEILAEPQLQIPTGDPNDPFECMIKLELNGDLEGKTYGVNTPPSAYFLYPPGDTLCYPNYPEYSSHFRASVNLAGAVVDTMWIESGEPPIIAIHTPYDYTTPYICGKVSPKGIGDIIDVCGSYAIATRCTQLGNNGWFKIDPDGYVNDFQSSVAAVANSRNEGLLGLFPIIGDTLSDINPWEFWDPISNPGYPPGTNNNPNMSKMKANTYMDSILAYTLPRLFEIMDLERYSNCVILKTEDHLLTNLEIQVSPNPASSEVSIQTPATQVMREIRVHDTKGLLVFQQKGIDKNDYTLNVSKMAPGLYIVQIRFDEGLTARQIIVQ